MDENLGSGNTPASIPESPTSEVKMLPQHEVNALIGAAKQKGMEKGYQQRDLEIKNQIPASGLNSNIPPAISDESKLRQIAQDEFNKRQTEAQAQYVQQQNIANGQRILNELKTKSVTAQSKFDDYGKVVDPDFNAFKETPEILAYANMTENPGEVLYDLAKNPSKMANVALLHRLNMPEKAFSEIKKLSDSIKVNESSASQPKAPKPLSQILPSTAGVGESNSESMSSKFRGRY